MKVLILVLSHLKDGYEPFIDMQKKTWDSISVPGMNTYFYYDGETRPGTTNEWGLDCEGSIDNSYNKMILAFKKALELKWDYLFRTNSTSYVVKSELIKLYSELSPTNTIAGHLPDYPYCFRNTGHIQGFSMMISRDIVQLLVDKYPKADGMDAHRMSRLLFDNENINVNNKHYPHGVSKLEDIDTSNPTHLYRVNKDMTLEERMIMLEKIHKLVS